ncbi:hypothetical protein [Parasutterella sp.]|uniref:hypothetical protein n=1 Tax=Parasutterella sp. TaxID=2049037 RepID=UPI003520F510
MAQTVEAKQVVLKDSEGGYLLPYAGVAQKALKDNDGNDIPTTYAKKADLNGYLPVDGKAVDSAKADTATSAASATKATQDSAGQQINSTYIKNVSVNGRTITFTRGDGTTFTITTQDTVTTNSSNWSVSNGTNGWARDNSTGLHYSVWGIRTPKRWWRSILEPFRVLDSPVGVRLSIGKRLRRGIEANSYNSWGAIPDRQCWLVGALRYW